MARRHLSVAFIVLLISGFISGCSLIFGGGGKKEKAPSASRESGRDDAAFEPARPPLHDSTESSALAARRARDAAIARDLAPQESEVQWPRPESLRLGDPGNETGDDSDWALDARQEARVSAKPVIIPQTPELPQRRRPVEDAPAEIVDRPEPPVMAELDAAVAAPRHTPGDEAVANKSLELTPEPPEPEAAPAAAAIPGHRAAAGAIGAAAKPNADAARKVTQNLRDNPTDLVAQLDHQLSRFLSDETVPELNSMSTLSNEDREILVALLDGLSNFRNALRTEDNMLLSRKIRPLLDMAARLRSQAELSIPTVALCRGVKGFGVYEPMGTRFAAGARNEAILYCEVANVSSQQGNEGVWESKLTQEVVLYTEGGQRVWSSTPQTTPDRARTRRHDFFLAQRILLPTNLTINRYILKVTVEDEQVKRLAEATIPIEIVAEVQPQPQHENLGPLAQPAGSRRTAVPPANPPAQPAVQPQASASDISGK